MGFTSSRSEISFPSLCRVPLNGVAWWLFPLCLTTIITAKSGRRRLIITLRCHYNTQFYYFYSIWFSTRHVTHHVINDPICNVFFLQLLGAQEPNSLPTHTSYTLLLKHFFIFWEVAKDDKQFQLSTLSCTFCVSFLFLTLYLMLSLSLILPLFSFRSISKWIRNGIRLNR